MSHTCKNTRPHIVTICLADAIQYDIPSGVWLWTQSLPDWRIYSAAPHQIFEADSHKIPQSDSLSLKYLHTEIHVARTTAAKNFRLLLNNFQMPIRGWLKSLKKVVPASYQALNICLPKKPCYTAVCHRHSVVPFKTSYRVLCCVTLWNLVIFYWHIMHKRTEIIK